MIRRLTVMHTNNFGILAPWDYDVIGPNERSFGNFDHGENPIFWRVKRVLPNFKKFCGYYISSTVTGCLDYVLTTYSKVEWKCYFLFLVLGSPYDFIITWRYFAWFFPPKIVIIAAKIGILKNQYTLKFQLFEWYTYN